MSGNLAAPYHAMCSLVFIKHNRCYIELNSIAALCIVTVTVAVFEAILIIPISHESEYECF